MPGVFLAYLHPLATVALAQVSVLLWAFGSTPGKVLSCFYSSWSSDVAVFSASEVTGLDSPKMNNVQPVKREEKEYFDMTLIWTWSSVSSCLDFSLSYVI